MSFRVKVGLKLKLFLIVMRPVMVIRKKWYNHRLSQAAKTLQRLDGLMVKAGWPRDKKRQFWRSIVNKKVVRDVVFTNMEKGL